MASQQLLRVSAPQNERKRWVPPSTHHVRDIVVAEVGGDESVHRSALQCLPGEVHVLVAKRLPLPAKLWHTAEDAAEDLLGSRSAGKQLPYWRHRALAAIDVTQVPWQHPLMNTQQLDARPVSTEDAAVPTVERLHFCRG